jgi:hypothetical protein
MKNLYTKNEFLIHKDEIFLNEGIVTGLFKGLFNSVAKLANKIKGTKEIDKIFTQYKGLIDQTFTKFGNIGAAEQASTAVQQPKQTQLSGAKKQNSNFEYNSSEVLNEVEMAGSGVGATPTDQNTDQTKQNTANQQTADKKNTEEQKNLVNLTPQKIAELSKITQTRIDELKKQFDAAINQVITRLSKNPNYSSDKLNQYALVQKSAFMTYVYDQWYAIYQKAGDKKKIAELVKVKQQNEANYKKAIADLNTKMSEKQQVVDVVTQGKYIYHNSKGKDITVTVVGKELGKDENGKEDTSDPKYKGMWKVKSGDSLFWISPESFKAKAKEAATTTETTVAPATTETTTVAPATTETTTVAPATTETTTVAPAI